jgi:hypothetical protein
MMLIKKSKKMKKIISKWNKSKKIMNIIIKKKININKIKIRLIKKEVVKKWKENMKKIRGMIKRKLKSIKKEKVIRK